MQWGVHRTRGTGVQINYPIAFSKFAKVVALDGFNRNRINCYSSLYEEPSLTYFKFNYDSETTFVNYIAIGVQQWGTYETANVSNKLITITFPVSFAATAYTVTLGHKSDSRWTNGANVNYVNKTVSDMTVYYCDGYGFSWLAIGMQQWGFVSSGVSVTINFPIAFSKKCFGVWALASGSHGSIYAYATNTQTTKSVIIMANGGASAMDKYWLAIGV